MSYQLLTGDTRQQLKALADQSIHCVVTSPPYWGLRDYGVDGQIGLEQTPDEYIAQMVEVFREVRRVLRDDGTVWLNLGDSYANTGGNNRHTMNWTTGGNPTPPDGTVSDIIRTRQDMGGLKPKDLCMIPARVALALQQPYYAGRIANVADRIWLAAAIDGEGCMFIHRRKAGQHNGQGYHRTQDTFGAGLEVANTSEAFVRRCADITGLGSMGTQEAGKYGRKQTLHRWHLRSNVCREVIQEVYPYLVAKQHEARLLLGCPSSGDQASVAHEALKGLHNGIATTVDFDAPDPKGLWKPGWYLRQEIIWKKPNPMPESVTDRCTRAHEMVYMLAKSRKYYYDAEAIKEPASVGARRFNGGHDVGPDRNDNNTTNPEPIQNRNKRSVWTVTTKPFKEAHFATFPPDLVRPMIQAGCPEGGTVLDPFSGAATTGVVCLDEGRAYVGIELNPEYQAIAEARLAGTAYSISEQQRQLQLL